MSKLSDSKVKSAITSGPSESQPKNDEDCSTNAIDAGEDGSNVDMHFVNGKYNGNSAHVAAILKEVEKNPPWRLPVSDPKPETDPEKIAAAIRNRRWSQAKIKDPNLGQLPHDIERETPEYWRRHHEVQERRRQNQMCRIRTKLGSADGSE